MEKECSQKYTSNYNRFMSGEYCNSLNPEVLEMMSNTKACLARLDSPDLKEADRSGILRNMLGGIGQHFFALIQFPTRIIARHSFYFIADLGKRVALINFPNAALVPCILDALAEQLCLCFSYGPIFREVQTSWESSGCTGGSTKLLIRCSAGKDQQAVHT